MLNNFIVLVITATLSIIFTIPTILLAKKLAIVTDSRKATHPAHTHKGVIPRAGGLPIFLAIFIMIIIHIDLNRIIYAVLLSGAILVITGLLDDIHDLSPYLRFFINIGVAVIVVWSGLGVPYLSNPFAPGEAIHLDAWPLLADLIAILWLVALMNMINWSKGVDGQLPGFVTIGAIFLGLVTQKFSEYDVSAQNTVTLAFIVAGAYLGFLFFNFYPQKILPGYGGGSLAGFLLGVLAILSFGKVGTLIIVLAMPLIDACYTIIRRILKGKSPFIADWGHFHHRLLELGWGRRRIAVFYWLITAILGVCSLFLTGITKILSLIIIAIILLTGIVLAENLSKKKTSKH